jgi:hypothetical protein
VRDLGLSGLLLNGVRDRNMLMQMNIGNFFSFFDDHYALCYTPRWVECAMSGVSTVDPRFDC